MIYVFKTSVNTENDIEQLKSYLYELGNTIWNFDLEDCDKILRIDSTSEISEKEVIKILHSKGFFCEALLD